MSENGWMFFGCPVSDQRGHSLYTENGRTLYPKGTDWRRFDGQLCFEQRTYRVPALTRFYGLGYSALAFWDNLGDSRPGSNSIIFAPTLAASPNTILEGAKIRLKPFAKHFENLDMGPVNKIYQEALQRG